MIVTNQVTMAVVEEIPAASLKRNKENNRVDL